MNQTIKNMDNVVIKIVEATSSEVEFESTRKIKTLINTYGTLLNDIKKTIPFAENCDLKTQKNIYNQGEKLKLVVGIIESEVIPLNLVNDELKAVDNLTTTNSKIKSVLNDIEMMTKMYRVRLASDIFNDNVKIKLDEIDNKESYENTYKLLEESIKNKVLVMQTDDNLRGTGKTTACIKKAHELNCLILTLSEFQSKHILELANSMNLKVTPLSATRIGDIRLPQFNSVAKNGVIVDDVADKTALNKLISYGFNILGGFTS